MELFLPEAAAVRMGLVWPTASLYILCLSLAVLWCVRGL
jgi:hypothetical protein